MIRILSKTFQLFMTEIFRFFFDTINPISVQYAGILTILRIFHRLGLTNSIAGH